MPVREDVLVGRTEECAVLDRLLCAARAKRSGVLVLRGERGIGRSSLLGSAVRHATGFRVDRYRGARAEMEFPYAGLNLLTATLGDALGTAEIARAVQPSPPGGDPVPVVDAVLDGLAARFTKGYLAAVAPMKRALETFRYENSSSESVRWLWLACLVAAEVWDAEAWSALANVNLKVVRETGALIALPKALTYRAIVNLHRGDLVSAAALVDEAGAITERTGTPPLADAALLIAAWRGDESRASELIEHTSQDADDRGEGFALTVAGLAAAVLYNGLGRYDRAVAAAQEVAELGELGIAGWSLAELAAKNQRDAGLAFPACGDLGTSRSAKQEPVSRATGRNP
jgi:tetratricopeptide (TPR) repeat protein